ncbi:MAG TPA: energy-coupling factor ABC transporter permease [Candidatus Omnitrophota bacterium]|nr:energy-coupling factor ABC transporter permease [Candidatus Omnitrophota bacterium]
MHIPDGFLSGPVNLAAFAVSAAAVGLAVKKTNGDPNEKEVPLMGVCAAFIFAAQMLNFPIAGGTSGHFLGALFAAILLGPWAGILVMVTVLAIQCLIFSDGGLTAVGSNVLNMGIVGGFGGFWAFRFLLGLLPRSPKSFYAASGLAAWLSVTAASVACALELAWSGTSPLRIVLPAMIGVHAVIGVGEAVITCCALSAISKLRPDLLSAYLPVRGESGAIHEQA